MTEDTYREHLNDLQLEVEELRAKLKEAQTGDAISRQAAIDALKNQMSDWNDDYNVPVRKSIENIERLPSAQPEQQWIPCSERLPEEKKEVLISAENGLYIAELEIINGREYWSEVIEYRYIENVEAWMPLPEPYMERRTDE